MCGRFVNLNKINKLSKIFNIIESSKDNSDIISYNLAPSQNSNIILYDDNKFKIEKLKWGINFFQKTTRSNINVINSRIETINNKILFKDSFLKRKCLIPANGYFEWSVSNNQKKPYFINVPNQELIFFAGIWKYNNNKINNSKNFSIITKNANSEISNIHSRMPIVLSINESMNYVENKTSDILDKNFVSEIEKELDYYEVSKFVNSPINNSEECIKSIN